MPWRLQQKKLYLEPNTEYELAETYLLAGYYIKAADALSALLPKWRENPWRLYYQRGYAYLELNELEKAKASFEMSIKSKSNVAAQGLLAFVLNRQGNIREARVLWEKNLKNDPSNPTIWINMGLSLEKDGDYSGALDHYKKAAMLKSDDKELQINIGNAYAGLEQYTDALNAYNQALSSSKRELAAYNIFLIARKKKDRDKAEKMAKLLQQEFSLSSCTKRANADIALWNGDTARAVSIFENLKDQDEDDWLVLAAVYAAKGNSEKTGIYLGKIPGEKQYEKTINSIKAQLAFKKGDYQQALSLLKTSSDTGFASQYNVAIAAYNASQFGAALSISEKLARNANGKDRADCCRLAGNAAFALKKWDTARQWYLQLSSIEANSAIVQYNLAVAFYNLNEIENAWKYYKKAQQIDPSIKNKDIESRYNSTIARSGDSIAVLDSVDIWYNMGVDLQNAGKDTAAEQLYLKIVAKEKNHSQAWNNLGALYGARGDIDNAEKAYCKAVEKRHDIPETYANLVNLYIELEEFVKARQWIIKGLGHNPGNQILTELKTKLVEAEKTAQKPK
ncbi:MAG TPA: tetratricopeptide repeat protein [Chitinispirillaceae bacterium]|nr:tetratricopeptide repeat protein [Chitinispirillaceae bacterium]